MAGARSLRILGHTDASRRLFPHGFGEIADTHSLSHHLTAAGIAHQTHDIFSLDHIPPDERYLLLTYPGELGRLIRALPPNAPRITRLYIEHEFSNPHLELHQGSDLVLTRNLLAHTCGLPPEKMLYLPTLTLPPPTQPDPTYRQRMDIPSDATLIGCSTRFLYGKNVECLLSAFPDDAILLLHGDFDSSRDVGQGEGHTAMLAQQLTPKPWLRWDQTLYSRQELFSLLLTCDATVHLSGGDDVSNSVVEQLALGLPMLLLGGGNRPSLFHDMALFVETGGPAAMRQGVRLFHTPDRDDLRAKLRQLIDDPHLRATLSHQAKTLAPMRFGDQITRQRLPLLLDPDPHAIVEAFEEDKARFAHHHWPH